MTRTPNPATLVGKAKPAPIPINLRLSADDDETFRDMAANAGTGPSALARKIIEHYIREHAPRTKKGKR